MCQFLPISIFFASVLLLGVRYYMQGNMRVCVYICCRLRRRVCNFGHVRKTT